MPPNEFPTRMISLRPRLREKFLKYRDKKIGSVFPARLGGHSEPWKIQRNDAVRLRKRFQHRLPIQKIAKHSVNQDERRSLTAVIKADLLRSDISGLKRNLKFSKARGSTLSLSGFRKSAGL